nr:hypothetical protein [Vibrio cholerae]
MSFVLCVVSPLGGRYAEWYCQWNLKLVLLNIKHTQKLFLTVICRKKIEQYERFNTDKFISILDLPSKYTYTENFKNRLHKLSIDGIVRPESFSLQLKNELKGMKATLAKRGVLKCLQPYEIKHDHIDTYYDGFVINLNNYLKRNSIKLRQDNISKVYDDFFKEYRHSRTGHWIIYKEYNGDKYFLDICEHGEDTYLTNVGLAKYRQELPSLFSG